MFFKTLEESLLVLNLLLKVGVGVCGGVWGSGGCYPEMGIFQRKNFS